MSDPKRAVSGASRAPSGRGTRQRGKRTGGQIALGVFTWIGIVALVLGLLGAGALAFIYANTTIPDPNKDFQTNVSTVFFSDGEQAISTFEEQNRVSISFDEMPENAKEAIVAGENESFWEDPGISIPGLARAVQTALTLLAPRGALLVAVYPGHEEGRLEGELLQELFSSLPQKQYSVACLRIVNAPDCPFFYLIEKNK